MFEAIRRSRSLTPPQPLPAPPFDEPPHHFIGAPLERGVTGHQLVVAGQIVAADDGEPIPGARLVRWHASPAGIYEDDYRALHFTDRDGQYFLQTLVPGHFAGLPRHIHFHVSAPGFATLEARLVWSDRLPPALNAFDLELVRDRYPR
jgi:protocatechuate 3,4-dioxygenase beta subunit